MSEIWAVLLIIVVLYFLIRPVVAGYKEGRSGQSEGRAINDPVPAAGEPSFHWPALNEYEFEVVGESYYQSTLTRLAGNHGTESAEASHEALLIPDDKNRYDEKAVAVLISGELVGHLSRDDARSFRRRLARKGLAGQVTSCGAMIVGGWIDRTGKKMHYGVKLDLKPFEQ